MIPARPSPAATSLNCHAAARWLISQKESIIEDYVQSVTSELKAAQSLDRNGIVDTLPVLIENLAVALARGEGIVNIKEGATIGKEHGNTRAKQETYTIDDLLIEYRILRGIIFAHLSQKVRLDPQANNIINDAIDRGVGNSAAEFLKLKSQREREYQAQQEKAFQSIAQFQTLFHFATVGMATTDIQGRFLEVNERTCRILGYSREELLKMSFLEIMHPDDRAINYKEYQQIVHGIRDDYVREKRYLKKGGSIIWTQIHIARLPTSSSHLPVCVTIIQDISAQKQAEDKAQAAFEREKKLRNEFEQWVQTFLEFSPVGIILMDLQSSQILSANRTAIGMLAEFSLAPFQENASSHSELVKDITGRAIPFEELPHRRLIKGEEVRNYEMTWSTEGQTEHHVLVSSKILPAVGIMRASGVLVLQDITELRKTQNELIQSLQLRDEFLSVASHELKTPLTALKLQLELFHKQAQKNFGKHLSYEEFAEKLKSSVQSVNRLVTMLDRLLDLSRIRARRIKLELTVVDLCKLIREVIDRLKDQMEAMKIEFQTPVCKPLMIYGDFIRIEQVLNNLISNAIKYGRGNPIEVSVEAIENWAVLRVRDQGIGISESDLSRIFERYERATDTESKESLGLGLFISREIVQAHGGTISVKSKPGSGSIFEVRLPLTG